MIIVDIEMALARENSRRQERSETRLSWRDLSGMVGIAPENLSKLKNGDFSMVRRTTMDNLCTALNCQPGDMFRHTRPEHLVGDS